MGYRYLSTSREAGNSLALFTLYLLCVQLPIYLARGRKLVVFNPTSLHRAGISPYLSREGPETGSAQSSCSIGHSYSPLSPSRGAGNRKINALNKFKHKYIHLSPSRGAGNLFVHAAFSICSVFVQIPIYLERGRKQEIVSDFHLWVWQYRLLFTLRGAGNNQFLLIHLPTPFITTYLPREGPETVPLLFLDLVAELVRIRIYLPREGPETLMLKQFQFETSRIRTYPPREGPETQNI